MLNVLIFCCTARTAHDLYIFSDKALLYNTFNQYLQQLGCNAGFEEKLTSCDGTLAFRHRSCDWTCHMTSLVYIVWLLCPSSFSSFLLLLSLALDSKDEVGVCALRHII